MKIITGGTSPGGGASNIAPFIWDDHVALSLETVWISS